MKFYFPEFFLTSLDKEVTKGFSSGEALMVITTKIMEIKVEIIIVDILKMINTNIQS